MQIIIINQKYSEREWVKPGMQEKNRATINGKAGDPGSLRLFTELITELIGVLLLVWQ